MQTIRLRKVPFTAQIHSKYKRGCKKRKRVDFDDIAYKNEYMEDYTETTGALGIDGPIPPKAYASGVCTLDRTRGQKLTEMTITISACQKTFASYIT